MKWIFKAKSKLRILIDTHCDLSGYAEVTICAKKPDDSVVNFPAVVKDEEKGIIFYDVVDENDFDISGWWIFWPVVLFDDDRTAAGRAVKVFVHEVGAI
ncbi:hypothetical protein SAMN04487977_11074 [Treponema bryantii]|uniref:Uncharacterized protein n=1 Tax=Treponema bryantii TaxID=163 RepID=A0A1H9IR36_9SPIR|nr:hypothetical protein [Treponema bryantii]SEQ77026.1 hypothetical protein SAMN04487977_11074 [Treponema bryantii]